MLSSVSVRPSSDVDSLVESIPAGMQSRLQFVRGQLNRLSADVLEGCDAVCHIAAAMKGRHSSTVRRQRHRDPSPAEDDARGGSSAWVVLVSSLGDLWNISIATEFGSR